MNDQGFLTIKNLRKSFGNKHILDDISLSIKKNSVTTIFGKSGEGKSVLLKCIVGILTADSGNILYKNHDIREKKKENAHILQDFAYLFQESALFDSLTVFENVAFPLRECLKIKQKARISTIVEELLESVSIRNSNTNYPSNLSGGMKKRVALARLLALKPKIMLCDEPTTGLDPVTGKAITELIVKQAKEHNITCIIISHDINIALAYTDTVAFLENGKISYYGNKEGMYTSNSALAQQFLDIAMNLK